MKIIKFTAENVKRLRAVEITPDGTLQVIGGRNAQGKSSVLDAIWLALGGGPAARQTTRPIRDGEDKASVTLDLGDLIVTRTWTGDKTALAVKSADGAKYSSPQSMLDELVGRLSFDPLEFTRLSPREQRDALLDLVDLPFSPAELDAQYRQVFDDRAEVGRRGKALGAVPTVDDALPAEEKSASAIISQIRAEEDHNREVTARRSQLAAGEALADRLADEIQRLQRDFAAAEQQAANAKAYLRTHAEHDTRPLEADLASIEETNAAIRANNQAKEKASQHADLHAQYDGLTLRLAELNAQKAAGLAAARFPVDGLGFDDSGVTYQGVPFSQASSAEQIRVSLGMAMALNPKLRVLRIMDGSLLDADSLALIAEQARDADYQVWIERVGNTDGVGVVIEDGQVAE
ncbi:MAG: AAA family ATPase [Propionibacterium sp.]|nr:AAA family ATPase [Propionibacterium sp.]